MAASVTTAVPSGLITTDWCIQNSVDWHNQPNTCANATKGQIEADFETICCNGDIVDTHRNLFTWPRPTNQTNYIDLADIVCCGVSGPQAGGIGPPKTLATACDVGAPTPLASLAATYLNNAPLYEVTYTSALYGTATTGDFIPTTMPSCLWMYTKTGVALRNITVPAARITSLPADASPGFGDDNPVTSTTIPAAADYSATQSVSAPVSAMATSTTSRSSSGRSNPGIRLMTAALGLVAVQLLFGVR